jgi:hypothetical protein
MIKRGLPMHCARLSPVSLSQSKGEVICGLNSGDEHSFCEKRNGLVISSGAEIGIKNY